MSELIRAKKSLGQNFLVDKSVSRRIVEAVSPEPTDLVIEIGPGTGALTRLLVESAGRVVAVEIDRRLIEELKDSILESRLRILEADALSVDWRQLIIEATGAWPVRPSPRVRVVANLPYYISTPILQKLIQQHELIFDMTLMLQAEVVDRITARPGGREYGYLSVLVQYYCDAKRLMDVPPSAFRPAPKVQSSVVRLAFRRWAPVEVGNVESFFGLVSASFAQRRKTILNNLKAAHAKHPFINPLEHALQVAKIDPRTRAEALSLADFAALHRALTQG